MSANLARHHLHSSIEGIIVDDAEIFTAIHVVVSGPMYKERYSECVTVVTLIKLLYDLLTLV